MIHDLYAVLWSATWGNNVAWLESLLLTGLTVWLLRRPLRRRADRIARWWHEHKRAALMPELTAMEGRLRKHTASEVATLHARLSQQDELISAAGLAGGGGGGHDD